MPLCASLNSCSACCVEPSFTWLRAALIELFALVLARKTESLALISLTESDASLINLDTASASPPAINASSAT